MIQTCFTIAESIFNRKFAKRPKFAKQDDGDKNQTHSNKLKFGDVLSVPSRNRNNAPQSARVASLTKKGRQLELDRDECLM